MRLRPLLLALVLAALAPGLASAQDVRVAARDEPVGQVLARTVRAAPLPFTLVGVHWKGSGRVWFRTAARPGRWDAWRPARPEGEDRPDATSPEAARSAGWRVGNPWWTGKRRWIQYRTSGRVARVRTYFVASPTRDSDPALGRVPSGVAARASRPAIVRRSGWGADESIVRGTPLYADRVRFSIVHHTAGRNGYSRAEAPAIVRGIQRYHVRGNGWNDIGYNFLVDRFGRIYEGRAGGMSKNVVGAHARGFNTGSVGVAVLGTYGSGRISTAARKAIERLLAWRLDVAHVDPRAVVDAVSYGNERFRAGATIRLRAVSGHRDTGYTSCPGTALYGQLGSIARAVSGIGLPKLYDPEVAGAVGEVVRFTARLSTARSWLVRVRDADGRVLAEGAGVGTVVDWAWDATEILPGRYAYTIGAGDAVRPASGVVPSPPPLDVTRLRPVPAVVTPNGDGRADVTRIGFSLTRTATVTARAEDAASGATVRTFVAGRSRPAGPASFSWAGRGDDGSPVPDGRYRIVVEARTANEEVSRAATVVVDRTLGHLAVSPATVSPNGDGRRERTAISFVLERPADVRVEIRRGAKVERALLTRSGAAGLVSARWDGRDGAGRPLRDGRVKIVAVARTALGTRRLAHAATVDVTRPRIRVLSFRRRGGVARVRVELSEASTVVARFGGRRAKEGRKFTVVRGAGEHWIRRRVGGRVVRVVAVDEGRNRSRRDAARLGERR